LTLDEIVTRSAARSPGALAVSGPDGALTYDQLDRLANQLARLLAEAGVKRGDRVGFWLDKSVKTVAVMQAALRLGAAYVPIDPMSPAARVAKIVSDCAMSVVVATGSRAASLRQTPGAPTLIATEPCEGCILWDDVGRYADTALPSPENADDELAYILYTSGSTGTPKGVCISHRNAMAFVEWAHALTGVRPEDRLSNHAPLSFDLSVFDLYAAFLAGASVTLVPEALAYSPRALVDFVVQERITVWYSVPSALILMMQEGGLLERADLSLRVVHFAGEPFPVKHLRPLRRHLPKARFFNLYGPTETNVCTFHEVTEVSDDRTEPVPIGQAASGDRVWLEPEPDDEGNLRPDVGELWVEGPTVMLGYWGHPPQGPHYRTGDLCRRLPDGTFEYLGRRDNMLKVRGRRIEAGEIEAALMQHPAIEQAAVVARGSGLEARLVACITVGSAGRPSLLEVKRHCAERLPRYMIVDELKVLPELPRSPNGKIDRRAVRETLTATP
jgi:amino acid adenylation domain-containing protein